MDESTIYLNAFNKMTQNLLPSENEFILTEGDFIMTNIKSIYKDKGETTSTSLQFNFYRSNRAKIHGHSYPYMCEIIGNDIKEDVLKEFFNAQNYNYQAIHDTVQALYEIGHRFGFYKEITELNHTKIEELYKTSRKVSKSEQKHLTKISFSSMMTEKRSADNLKKKVAKIHNNFYLYQNNEIQPIVSISLPYSSSYDFLVKLNLHPSQEASQKEHLEQEKIRFSKVLEEHFESVLKRKLKMKKEEIAAMTLEEKLNYLIVIDMNTI